MREAADEKGVSPIYFDQDVVLLETLPRNDERRIESRFRKNSNNNWNQLEITKKIDEDGFRDRRLGASTYTTHTRREPTFWAEPLLTKPCSSVNLCPHRV